MGNFVQTLSDSVSLIASNESWIEGLATQQLLKTSQLEGMKQVVGMPDLHPGRGYPVGASFFSVGRVYPALVGNDIGCGMSLWQTSLRVAKLNLDKLAKRLDKVEGPLGEDWADDILQLKKARGVESEGFDMALGTIGGGNHFAEFQRIDEVYDAEVFNASGLNTQQLQLLVHSGSRGLGQAILTKHVSEHGHAGLTEVSNALAQYISEHNDAVRWAELNRYLIAQRFLAAVRSDGQCLLDVNHNLVTQVEINSCLGWLHRKGATPSDKGLVMIPGSRSDFSYLVKPRHNGMAAQSLYSLAHGAGRKWQRGTCKGRLDSTFKPKDLLKTALGSRVICGNKELLYDEAPQAYKKGESVINDLVNADLIDVIAKTRPVLTFKTQGGCAS
ncbi:RNA-splicing ligase RtcB [Grimontia celer]|uniref:3'-phosphate/5'-hydroxy nucleic acid ligase n=1 Tax=Grimontia celer TaxID=1796497 RepID=A0A128ER76_9GAMM|nr:RNA ligase RtcB family protein [Grimontia celer]CZF77158.1 RNA-splicing ligase RtcB [Grimontia celer]